MIRICITIPEASDPEARLRIEAEQIRKLHIETEQHDFVLLTCKCGCKRRFMPKRQHQEFVSAVHRKRYSNNQRRKTRDA
jgi:hypothetical protein